MAAHFCQHASHPLETPITRRLQTGIRHSLDNPDPVADHPAYLAVGVINKTGLTCIRELVVVDKRQDQSRRRLKRDEYRVSKILG